MIDIRLDNPVTVKSIKLTADNYINRSHRLHTNKTVLNAGHSGKHSSVTCTEYTQADIISCNSKMSLF